MAQRDLIVAATAQAMGFEFSAALGPALAAAVREGEKIQSKNVQAIAQIFQEDRFRQRRQRVHTQVGQGAQRSVRAAYAQRRNNRHTPAYRTTAKKPGNTRLAGGALARALSSDFYEATPNRLSIINTAKLNAEAKHWRRINYGAGAAAGTGGAPRMSDIHWSGLVVGSLGLQPDPRPAFRLPRGVWVAGGERITSGSGGMFYPAGERKGLGVSGPNNKARMTAGIAASNFLDAPVRYVARELPAAYEAMYQDIYADLGKKALSKRLNITAPRPKGSSSRLRSAFSRIRGRRR